MRKQLVSAISGLLFLTSNIAAADEPKVEYGVEEIIKQYIPQINLPVPEQLKVKDFKELHWESNKLNYNWYTDIWDPDSLTMNFSHDNGGLSQFNYDDGWSYQYSFKWRGHLFNKPKD